MLITEGPEFEKSTTLTFMDPQDGYLDDIFDVLDAHQHPCIVMGRSALLWMGAGVLQSSVSNIVKYRIAAFSD